MSLKITALPVGEMVGLPRPLTHMYRGWTETLGLKVFMFLIEGGEELTLVDTGTPPPEIATKVHGYDVRRPPEEDPIAQLATAGYRPDDVTRIVNTHLHWDHCGNNGLFTNATAYVQRAELEYGENPLPMHTVAYERFPDTPPLWRFADSSVIAVDGEFELEPGIRLVPLPGHTPGSQGVLVDCDSGPHLIAGDCVDTYANWEGDAAMPHIPSGVYTDLLAYMESFDRIDGLSCTVIPSHDYEVADRGPFQ